MTSVVVDFVVVAVEITTSPSTFVVIDVSVPATCSHWYVHLMKAVYVRLVRTFCKFCVQGIAIGRLFEYVLPFTVYIRMQ